MVVNYGCGTVASHPAMAQQKQTRANYVIIPRPVVLFLSTSTTNTTSSRTIIAPPFRHNASGRFRPTNRRPFARTAASGYGNRRKSIIFLLGARVDDSVHEKGHFTLYWSWKRLPTGSFSSIPQVFEKVHEANPFLEVSISGARCKTLHHVVSVSRQ